MKKISLILSVGLLSAHIGLAQRGAVTTAKLNLDSGKLDVAQSNIDNAIKHDKTKDDPKTWYYRGMVYESMLTSPLEPYRKLSDRPIEEAVASYRKALELDSKKKLVSEIQPRLDGMYNYALQNSIEAYNDKNFDKALAYNNIMEDLRPADTTVYLNKYVFAASKEDYTTARQAYEKLIEIGHDNVDIYNQLVFIARQVDKDDNRALQVVQQARQKHPNDKNLMMEEINLYIATGKIGELKGKLQEALKADPNNASLHTSLGTIYFNEAYDEKASKASRDAARANAIASLRKGLELDKDNLDAAYNLGVIYYNQAAEANKTLVGMDAKSQNSAKGAKVEADIKKHLEQALPYLETAYRVNPKDPNVLQTLAKTYMRLRKNAEAEKINKEYEAVTASN
jgi:tetratricopeptide (TPR) repeat protein